MVKVPWPVVPFPQITLGWVEIGEPVGNEAALGVKKEVTFT